MGRPRVNFTCTVPDCGKTAHTVGYCYMHLARWKKYGTTDFQRCPRALVLPAYPEDALIPREQRVIWAAGFFDGEGCVGINRRTLVNGKKSCLLQCVAVNSVRESVEILQVLFGGSVRAKTLCKERLMSPDARWKDTYYWTASSNQAANALREMLPYLIVKAEQARIAIEFQGGVVKQYGRRGWPVTPGEYERREMLRDRIMALNKRGRPTEDLAEPPP